MEIVQGNVVIRKMEKRNNFGMLRLVGATMVIIGHMYGLTGSVVPSIMWNTINSLGVAIFFTIGGYLITVSWQKDSNFIRYIVKRAFRIFPALVVCVFFSVFIIGVAVTKMPLSEYLRHEMTINYFKNIILRINYTLPMVFDTNPFPSVVNGSIWCLPVEFLLYLFIPIYISVGNKISSRKRIFFFGFCTLLIIALGCAYNSAIEIRDFVFYGMSLKQIATIIPYYFIGSFIALGRFEKYLNIQIAIVLLIVSTGLAYIKEPYAHLFAYGIIPYIFLSFAITENPIFCKINKIDISYGMFLFSFTIQQTLIYVFLKNNLSINIYVLIILSMFFSVIMGILTEKYIERPAMKLSKEIIKCLSNK